MKTKWTDYGIVDENGEMLSGVQADCPDAIPIVIYHADADPQKRIDAVIEWAKEVIENRLYAKKYEPTVRGLLGDIVRKLEGKP